MAGRANDRQVGGDHYKIGTKPGAQEHWDYAWQHNYDQFQYCITKYVDRHKYKNGLADLRKAQHHLEKYIELLEAEAKERQAETPAPMSEGASLFEMEEEARRKRAFMLAGAQMSMGDFGPGRTYVNPDL